MSDPTPLVPAGMADLAQQVGFSPGLITGDWVLISGQAGMRPGTTPQTPEEEYRIAFENVGLVLAEANLGFQDLVQVTSYHTDLSTLPGFMAVRAEFLTAPVAPTWTALGVAALGDPRMTVEIAATARLR